MIIEFFKPGKLLVIEIDDHDYALDEKSRHAIEMENDKIPVRELDKESYILLDRAVIEAVVKTPGAIDYLDEN